MIVVLESHQKLPDETLCARFNTVNGMEGCMGGLTQAKRERVAAVAAVLTVWPSAP